MEDDKYCPICYEEYSREKLILKDSCYNNEIESDCKHWFCTWCLTKMYLKNINECPLCRIDISELISCYGCFNCEHKNNTLNEIDVEPQYTETINNYLYNILNEMNISNISHSDSDSENNLDNNSNNDLNNDSNINIHNTIYNVYNNDTDSSSNQEDEED